MTKQKKRPKRPPEIDEAVKQLRAASRAELAKKEVVQFRMDTEDLQQLYQVCAKHKKPVGTLVRELVLQMIARELPASEKQSRSVGATYGAVKGAPEAECWVHEKVADPGLLFSKDILDLPAAKQKEQRLMLQSLYERFMSCRQEESAVINDLFGIMLTGLLKRQTDDTES